MRAFDLKKHLSLFLSQHLREGAPILVGVSGGIDSLSLLHLLQGERRRIVAVHVDHGWREESAEEAESLRNMVMQMGVDYVGYRLPKAPFGENLEDWSRTQRYICFKRAGDSFGITTLLLAHQADDQVETVVKRFFEGASVLKLRGMRPVDHREGLTILRPLLDVPRKELERYVSLHGLRHIEDPSNADLSYLRPRLRHLILPFLERSFGKKIVGSILNLSEETLELESYIQEQLPVVFDLFKAQKCAVAVAKQGGEHRSLVRSLIRHLLMMQAIAPLSRHQMNRAVDLFCSICTETACFHAKNGSLFVQGGMACAVHTSIHDSLPILCTAQEGSIRSGFLDISWRETIFSEHRGIPWQSFFLHEESRLYIPLEPFVICATTNDLLTKTKKKLLSPALLRTKIPGIVQGFRLVADFLTGYTSPLKKGDRCFELSAHMA